MEKTESKGIPTDPKVRAARAVVAAAGKRNTTLDPERLQRAKLELKHARLRRLHREIDELLDEDES